MLNLVGWGGNEPLMEGMKFWWGMGGVGGSNFWPAEEGLYPSPQYRKAIKLSIKLSPIFLGWVPCLLTGKTNYNQ